MARKGTESITMYTTRDKQLRDAFEVVHKHYGNDTYSQSGVLAELVKDKYREIKEGKTRRDQVAALRQELAELRQENKRLHQVTRELIAATGDDHDTDHG